MELLREKMLPLLIEHKYAVGLAIIGLGLLGYGLVGMATPTKDESITFTSNAAKPSTAKKEAPKQLLIDVSGAVNKPGVYSFPAESRVQDAIAAAGGFAQHADMQKIAQSLNLAAPLTDGAKLYIPATGEQMAASAGVSGKVSGTSVLGDATGAININTADEAGLDSLSGVGKVTAGKIIANRPYGSIEELLEKKVVGQAVFEKIKGRITVY